MSCKNETKKERNITVNYPTTQKVDTVTNYFGTDVKDPYRWLEDDRSKETEEWVKTQNQATFGYLENIPYREELKNRLEKLWNYEKIGSPFKEGDYTYFYKNDGLQNQYVIYRYKTGDDPITAEVFLDPNTFKEDGTISLGGASFSKSGKILAYAISEGGSDWRKILIMDAESKKIVEDTIVDVKFSGMSWYKDTRIGWGGMGWRQKQWSRKPAHVAVGWRHPDYVPVSGEEARRMVFWDWFIILFIFIPMIIAWIYTAFDIFARPDIGALAKFLWLLLILFIPIIGMLIYFIARPDEFLVE